MWLRDSVHVAHALWRTQGAKAALLILEPLLAFQVATVHRFDDVIEGRVDRSDPQKRPHIRFDGLCLAERPEDWAHAQNDALGIVLWLASSLWASGEWTPSAAQQSLLMRYPAYFEAIDFTRDPDSGHWEETRRVNASSIGCVVAGLEALVAALERGDARGELAEDSRADRALALRDQARTGRQRLDRDLPFESPPEREADAALLFLVEPLGVVERDAADAIVDLIRAELLGPHGIKRYHGDSYWGADYRQLFAAEVRSADTSASTAARDAKLRPGNEAQWCIFDPVLATWHARRYQRDGRPDDRRWADWHLRRALGQLAGPGEWCDEGLCTEAWFIADSGEGWYRPNDQTPLAWTQANLGVALATVAEIL